MSDLANNPETLAKYLLDQDAVEPVGWFNGMSGMYSWGLAHLSNPRKAFYEDELKELDRMLETPGIEPNKLLLRLVEKHAWLIGRLNLPSLANKVWPALSREARGNHLAGLSNHLTTDEHGPWIEGRIGEADFSPMSFCELAANLLAKRKWPVAVELLSNNAAVSGKIRRRLAVLGLVVDDWRGKELNDLSTRVLDVLLEAAIRLDNLGAMSTLLARGANPNIGIWELHRTSNHRYSALSYAIKYDREDCFSMLLDAGADPNGNDFGGRGQPLFYALFRHKWETADRLLKRGARFEGETSNHLPAHHARPDTVEWVRQVSGKQFKLESISIKPQFFSPFNIYPERYTHVTAFLETGSSVSLLQKYALRGLDVRPTAEELAVAIDRGEVTNLAFLLELAQAPELVREQMLAKTWIRADKDGREYAEGFRKQAADSAKRLL